MPIIVHVMVDRTSLIWSVSKLYSDSSVSAVEFEWILISNRFSPLLIVHGSPYETSS